MRRTGPIAAMFALLACSAVWAPLAGCPPTPPPPPELVDDGADVGTRPILIHIPGVGDLILHEDGSTGGVRSSESANGQTWSNANVGELGPAFAPDAARDGQDVHVSYSHRLSGGLRWAALEGGAWAVETADPITNRLGLSAIAVSGDQPTIAYFSANALGALTIANAKRLGPGSWETNEVEGLLPPFQVIWSARPRIAAGGGVTSIAYTVRHARPARGASVNQVRLAQGSGASWTVHTIFDDLGIGGHLADMERDALGTLHLLVYAAPETGDSGIVYATYAGGATSVLFDSRTAADPIVGGLFDMTLDAAGRSVIAYLDAVSSVRYARWQPGAQTWTSYLAAAATANERWDHPSIALDDAGKVRIAFQNARTRDLFVWTEP